ncbi:MAG TPA: hypothetical protein VN442_01055 [Bryobacteraceae bacterium]|nr:hypothetical protein [Bryobacteraceae bacterium]
MRKIAWLCVLVCALPLAAQRFEGRYFRGAGDVEYLRLLDTARRILSPDPQFQNLAMFYEPRWNGYVEGPTWDAWWIQNSYGPTYCSLPFLEQPYTTFLKNSQDLWWDQMGDGKRIGGPPPFDFIAPDGALCDAARPGMIIYVQGDGRFRKHDWAVEFTAAGIIMQSEMLLIGRDPKAIAHYLPKLERSANFIETRRDPKNNLFLAGPAANLMAPSYAGYRRPDGSYGKAYLAGLSVTYIAALDRLIELQKMAGAAARVKLYTERRDAARSGLPQLMTEEGYFVKSIDPDGTRHGVYGAAKYGYFEAAPNHDAIAFRVVDDAQAEKIYNKMASLPGLRPHDLILTNYPSLDDMYEDKYGFTWGRWVNGAHWSTCEARMMMGYSRLGKFEDARKSMKRILALFEQFRIDNPLPEFGSALYQPDVPINTVYDTLGVPAAFLRGLFEYVYRADGLTVLPHIPPGITELEQEFPVKFGRAKLYLATYGTGPVTGVVVNGRPWKSFDKVSVTFPAASLPAEVHVAILLGGASAPAAQPQRKQQKKEQPPATPAFAALDARAATVAAFRERLAAAGLGSSYEAAHAQLGIDMVRTAHQRAQLLAAGKLKLLPQRSQAAADQLYIDTANKLFDGLETVLAGYANSTDPAHRKIYGVYRK